MSITRTPPTGRDTLGPDEEGIYKRLGRIEYTVLGYEDHGIFTATVGFDFGGWHQGIPGACLDTPVKDADGKFLYREGSAFGHDYIIAILQAVGVRKWEDLKGQTAYALYDSDGFSAMIIGIETEPTAKDRKRVIFKELAEKHGLTDDD